MTQALIEIQRVLSEANSAGKLTDTIWRGPAETLFDYIQNEIDAAGTTGCTDQPQIAEPEKFTVDSEMSRAFEIEYGQDWKDPDWRRETGVWASAWHKATNAARAAAPQAVQPSPEATSIAPTFMTNDQAIAWAWADVRKEVGTENWTTGDSCNFYGFFLHGWNYRGQYELQRNVTKAAVMREIADTCDYELQQTHAHPAEGVPALDVSQATIDFLKESMQDCDDSPSDVAIAHDLEKLLRAATQPAAQGLDTGNTEADRLIGRLLSADPDFEDCTAAANFIRELTQNGPDGFATWKDAAVVERALRAGMQRAISALPRFNYGYQADDDGYRCWTIYQAPDGKFLRHADVAAALAAQAKHGGT